MKRSIKCILLVIFILLILFAGYRKWIYHLKNISTKKVNVETGYIYPAQVNGKYGFINKNGKWVIKPRFEYAGDLIEEIIKRVLRMLNTMISVDILIKIIK